MSINFDKTELSYQEEIYSDLLQNQLLCEHEPETSFTLEHEPDCELVHPDSVGTAPPMD